MIAGAVEQSTRWPFGPAGTLFLALHAVALPVLVARSRRRFVAGAPLPPKERYFASTIVQLCMFAAFSVLVARVEFVQLFAHYTPRLQDLGLALLALALAVAAMRPRWRKAVERGVPTVQLFSPETGKQLALWIGVCFAAGVGEEITYRGVLTVLLARGIGNVAAAGLLSAVLFGLVHMIQGWRSAAVTVLFALGFQVLVWMAGTLYVAMAVHVVYDLIAGWSYGRLVRAKRERDARASAAR